MLSRIARVSVKAGRVISSTTEKYRFSFAGRRSDIAGLWTPRPYDDSLVPPGLLPVCNVPLQRGARLTRKVFLLPAKVGR